MIMYLLLPALIFVVLFRPSSAADKVSLGGGHSLRFVGTKPARTQELQLAIYPANHFAVGFSITFWFRQGK